MPLSRLYARFLGGDLQLLTLPSWGCSFKLSVANTVVGELDRATRHYIKHHLMVRALYKTPFNGAPRRTSTGHTATRSGCYIAGERPRAPDPADQERGPELRRGAVAPEGLLPGVPPVPRSALAERGLL